MGARSGELARNRSPFPEVNTSCQIAEKLTNARLRRECGVARSCCKCSVGLEALGWAVVLHFAGARGERKDHKRAFDTPSRNYKTVVWDREVHSESFKHRAYHCAQSSGTAGAERLTSSFRQADDTVAAPKVPCPVAEQARMAHSCAR